MSNRILLSFLVLVSLVSCTHSRAKRYSELLDKLIGNEKKDRVASVLGAPARCNAAEGGELCEYRTAAGRNLASPGVQTPTPGFGPDVSPYDHFDVIHVYYNDVGLMREWEPIVLPDSR